MILDLSAKQIDILTIKYVTYSTFFIYDKLIFLHRVFYLIKSKIMGLSE